MLFLVLVFVFLLVVLLLLPLLDAGEVSLWQLQQSMSRCFLRMFVGVCHAIAAKKCANNMLNRQTNLI